MPCWVRRAAVAGRPPGAARSRRVGPADGGHRGRGRRPRRSRRPLARRRAEQAGKAAWCIRSRVSGRFGRARTTWSSSSGVSGCRRPSARSWWPRAAPIGRGYPPTGTCARSRNGGTTFRRSAAGVQRIDHRLVGHGAHPPDFPGETGGSSLVIVTEERFSEPQTVKTSHAVYTVRELAPAQPGRDVR